MIGKRKDRGGGGAKKISPARGHCCFRKLRSPTNGVSDWCGSTLSVHCLSITSQIVRFVRQRNTANSVVSGVSSIPLSRNLVTFYVNLDTGFGKSLIFQTFVLIKPTMTGNGFERGCRVNLPGN